MLKQLVDRLTAVSIVGVDLGSSWLKLAEVASSNGQVILRRCAVAPIGQGDVTSVLKQLTSKAGMATTPVAVGIASPEVIVKPLALPPMPKKELASAIRLEAEQAILNGHTLSEMAVDWYPLSSTSKDLLRGLLAVAPRAAITARMQPVKAAGLRPVVVDVEGLALWNAYWVLVGSREPSPKSVLLINIGARTTNLVIAKGPDELLFVRDLQLGTAALAGGRETEWVSEVRDSLSYVHSQAGLRALDAVSVTGGGSGPTLIPLLKAAVPSSPVTFWNPLTQLARDASSPSVEEALGPLLAVAIGLSLRQRS